MAILRAALLTHGEIIFLVDGLNGCRYFWANEAIENYYNSL